MEIEQKKDRSDMIALATNCWTALVLVQTPGQAPKQFIRGSCIGHGPRLQSFGEIIDVNVACAAPEQSARHIGLMSALRNQTKKKRGAGTRVMLEPFIGSRLEQKTDTSMWHTIVAGQDSV